MISFSTSDRFAHVDAASRDRLEVLTKLDQFQPGEQVWAEGSASDWVGIICSGALELCVPGREGELVVTRLGPGDLYGEIETFAELPAGSKLVATADTLVRVCPKNPLKQELRSNRDLALGLLFAYCRSMSEKIRQANTALAERRTGPTSLPPPSRLGRGDRPPHLTEDEAAWLTVLGRKVEFDPDQPVVTEGDTTRSFYVIDDGEVEVRRGADVTLARLGRRDMFGFMSFLDGQPRSASVVTVSPAKLTSIESTAVDTALKVNFTVAFRFLGTLCSVLGRTFGDTVREAARA